MGRIFQSYLMGSSVWHCQNCYTPLANNEDILSKEFRGRHGKAYLFNTVENVVCGKKEERKLITGIHRVADVHCSSCFSYLGWKYINDRLKEEAFDDNQKYKEGKFVIEKATMVKSVNIPSS